jgi:hypothetical protein
VWTDRRPLKSAGFGSARQQFAAAQVVALLAEAAHRETQPLRDTARGLGAASDAMIAGKASTISNSINVNLRERCFKSEP